MNNLTFLFVAAFTLIGLRYTYRAFMYRFVHNEPFSDPAMQRAADSMPPHRSTAKALAAFILAICFALIYYW